MDIKLNLEGRASLIHIQTPDANLHKDEYFARIRIDNGSIYGKERPLVYNVPLTKQQYDELNSQTNSEGFRDLVGEAEGYQVSPYISVKCTLEIAAQKGKV